MADNKPSSVNISQLVESSAKIALNKLTNDLCNYALAKGLREPGKGEVLSKLIKVGATQFEQDPASYFKQ